MTENIHQYIIHVRHNPILNLNVFIFLSLIHSIVTKVMRLAQNPNGPALAPALVDTYSRLLVYMEIESLGIKGFISE